MSQKIKLTASAECTTIDNKIEVIVKLTPGAYTVGSNRFTHVTQGGIQANASKIRYIQGSITYEKIFDGYVNIDDSTVIDSMTYSEFYNTTGINLTKSFRIEVALGSPYSTSSKFIALSNYLPQNNVQWLSLVSNSTGYEEDFVIITGLTNTSTIMYVFDVKSTHYFDGKINFGINSVTLNGNDYIVQLGDVTKSFTITPTSYTTQVSLDTANSIFKRFTSLERAPTSNQKFTVNRRDIDVERPYRYYIVIRTNATYTCDYGSSTLYSSATTSEMFYPLTDIVTASAPIALDAGNNLLYVDASKCFSSNMGYIPKRYCISHNTDTDPVDTQSDTGIELIPHFENRNGVGVDVAVFYDTLEGVEKYVVSDEVSVDLIAVQNPETPTVKLTAVNDTEYTDATNVTRTHSKHTYEIIDNTDRDIVDAFDMHLYLQKKFDNSIHSFKFNNEDNSAISSYYQERGQLHFDGTQDLSGLYGGIVKLRVNEITLTDHYPAPTSNWPNHYENFGDIIQWDGTKATSYESGSGTVDDPYIIATPSQLAYMVSGEDGAKWSSKTFDNYYKIKDGIMAFDMCGNTGVTLDTTASELKRIYSCGDAYRINNNTSPADWCSLTVNERDGGAFCGHFDGNGVIIYNLYCGGNDSALFPTLDGGAVVENITLHAVRSYQ